MVDDPHPYLTVVSAFAPSAGLGVVIAAHITSLRQFRAHNQTLQNSTNEADKRRSLDAVLSVSEKELQEVYRTREIAVEFLALIRKMEHQTDKSPDDVNRLAVLAKALWFRVPPYTGLGEQICWDLFAVDAFVNEGQKRWNEDAEFWPRMTVNLLKATVAQEQRIHNQILQGEYIPKNFQDYVPDRFMQS